MDSSNNFQNLKPKQGISTLAGILITFFAALIASAGIWTYYYYKIIPDFKKTDNTTTNQQSNNWKTLNLETSKGKVTYPSDWNVRKNENDSPGTHSYVINYDDQDVNNNGSITEYDIASWIVGPKADEGFVQTNAERQKSLDVMKDIYYNETLTSEDKAQLSELSLEFFGLNAKGRVALEYFSSSDNKSRGISFISTSGNDMGLAPIYIISLYNPEKNVFVSFSYAISLSAPEVKTYNDKLENKNLSPNEMSALAEQVFLDFKNLVESKNRSDLSFGSLLDTIDKVAKSLKF